MNYLTKIIALTCLILFSCSSDPDPFSVKDVQSTQKLFGLNFKDAEVDSLHRYLVRNLEGYDSMRTFPLTELDGSVIQYDLLPDQFEVDNESYQFQLKPSQSLETLNQDLIPFYSIDQLASLIRNGSITSVELTQLYIDRIKQYDSQLEAVITLMEEDALATALERDEELRRGIDRGLLHGIPYGLKDILAVEGYPTTWGSAPYKNQNLNYTSTVATRLEEAGAVLIAKLTSGALARGDVWFGGKTKNPWNPEEGASGSSAGSGSATAAGLVGFSIGTETLGSIVSPSSRNGVTGLRPTYGRVSRYGVMSLSWSMDKVGPICRTARGCAIVFNAIMGADERDKSVMDASFVYDENQDVTKYKVAYIKDLFSNDSARYNVNNETFLENIGAMGISMDSISLPKDVPYDVFDIILRAESGAFFDDLVLSGGVDEMVQQGQRSRANSLRQSRFVPAVEYLQANRHRKRLIEKVHAIFSEYDIILSPTFGGEQLLITNLTGHPALCIPTGLDEEGRPTSVTLIGNLFDEGKLLELGTTYQQQHQEILIPPLFQD